MTDKERSRDLCNFRTAPGEGYGIVKDFRKGYSTAGRSGME